MKAQSVRPAQREAFSLSFHPATTLVTVAWLLRQRGLRLHWNTRQRTLETIPV